MEKKSLICIGCPMGCMLSVTLENGEVNQILKYEGSAVAPVFTRTGYTFIGWDKTISESVFEDITVTAQWKANRYTLTLIL